MHVLIMLIFQFMVLKISNVIVNILTKFIKSIKETVRAVFVNNSIQHGNALVDLNSTNIRILFKENNKGKNKVNQAILLMVELCHTVQC